VKDLDNLRDEHINKTYDTSKGWSVDEVKYQKFIDDYVRKQKKPLILVGLNDNHLGTKQIYYNTHAQYKYYINLDNKEILKQKCLRMLTEEIPNDKHAMNDLMNNNKKFIKGMKFAINGACNIDNITKTNKKINNDYKKQDYKFMTRENIFNEVSNIIRKNLYG